MSNNVIYLPVSILHLTTLLLAKIIQHWLTRRSANWKHVEGSKYDLIWGTILPFSWTKWVNP